MALYNPLLPRTAVCCYELCGKEFRIQYSQISKVTKDKNAKVFCCILCMAASRKIVRKETPCSFCGDVFLPSGEQMSRLLRGLEIFCTNRCKRQWMRETKEARRVKRMPSWWELPYAVASREGRGTIFQCCGQIYELKSFQMHLTHDHHMRWVQAETFLYYVRERDVGISPPIPDAGKYAAPPTAVGGALLTPSQQLARSILKEVWREFDLPPWNTDAERIYRRCVHDPNVDC